MSIKIKEVVLQKVCEIIEKAKSYSDKANDLNRIEMTYNKGTEEEMAQLDTEMRNKYPEIYSLYPAINALLICSSQRSCSTVTESRVKANLHEDYFGIICSVAVDEGIKYSFKECLYHTDDQF